ncbi:hypothetical protein D3C87_2127660 [compost metagenome]
MAHPSRSVERRRLVELTRDRLQRRQEDHHVEAEALPDTHNDDRRHSRIGIVEPIDRSDAEPAEDVVQ